jgi:1-deoxy-D-xylulose-5-phosphate reductoisomerase
MRKRLIILGSTGSIGTRALDVVADFRDSFEVVALSTHTRIDLLAEQVRRFQPKAVCVTGAGANFDASGAKVHVGERGLTELVEDYDADLIVVATVGFVGLAPTLRAIELGRQVALANKEVLVVAGDLVMAAAHARDVRILPIDSEHNAVFQCVNGCGTKAIRRIVLTASGGPFRRSTRDEMATITPDQALQHPTWNMGPKITIDSATMMNKGFEVIEATHLFDVPVSKVQVVIHPQSTIHSMVEYIDGSIIAQLGVTDMYLPIQNVLLYPDRRENRFESLDFAALGALTFEKPDAERFPCLGYAYEAADGGGTYPAVLNAANEIAVSRFLSGEIPFMRIPQVIRHALDAHDSCSSPDVAAIQAADQWARRKALTV